MFGYERGAFTGSVARKVGRFELAEGGTIFLDEIGELSPNLQAKLLRVLQDHSFERLGGTESKSGDFRVLAATNRDLEATVREKLFREDLFYRLNVFGITVPPLRERRADIVPLAEHFLRMYSDNNGLPAIGFSEEAILMLQTYSYPGNVRELENMVERAVLLARRRVICWRTQKKLVENAIRLASGNKTEAANRLQINRRLLYQKMIEHQIKE